MAQHEGMVAVLIKLSDICYVAADQIVEVTLNEPAACITVRTINGIGHQYEKGYGVGIYAALDRLVAEINAATNKERA